MAFVINNKTGSTVGPYNGQTITSHNTLSVSDPDAAWAADINLLNDIVSSKVTISVGSVEYSQNPALLILGKKVQTTDSAPANGTLPSQSSVIAGTDGTLVRTLKTDSSGRPQMAINGATDGTPIGNIADRLKVTLGSTTSLLNGISSYQPIKLIGDIQEGSVLDPNIWTDTLVGSGSLTPSNNVIQLTTGTTANSSVFLASTRKARFILETSNAYISRVRLGDTGATNNVRRWGAYDSQNGVYFELNGTTPSIGVRSGGSDTIVTSFNGSVSFTLDTNYHLYEIDYDQENAYFYQDGGLIHTYKTTTVPIANTLHFHLGAENTNSSGGTSNVSLYVMGASVMRYGYEYARERYYHPVYTTKIQSVAAQSGGNVASLTVNINPTQAGSLIVVSACRQNGNLTISDSGSQSYSTAFSTSAGSGKNSTYLFYFANSASGISSVTITCSPSSSDDMSLIVTEYAGINTSSPLDKTSTNTAQDSGTATMPWTSNATATTTQANELLIGVVNDIKSGATTNSPGSSWITSNYIQNSSGGMMLAQQEQYVSATGAYSATGTLSAVNNYMAGIATFKMPAANLATLNSPVVLKYGAGTFRKVIINTLGTGSASITFYDNITNSGTVIAVLSLTDVINEVEYDVDFDNGLTMVITSQSADFTVIYD